MQRHFNDASYALIGAYYEVYNHTSRTFPEYIYELAMLEELRRRGVPATRQDEYRIIYKNHLVGLQQLDMLIAGELAVENKVVDRLTKLHKAQCISYIKTVGKQSGLLFNFGGQSPEFSRLYFDPAKKPTVSSNSKVIAPGADWLYPDLVYEIVAGLYEVHHILGAGFIHRIYAEACNYELQERGLAARLNKRIQVAYKNKVIGDIAFANILIEGKIILFPAAISNLSDIHWDNLKQWLILSGARLGVLANFNAVHLAVKFIRM